MQLKSVILMIFIGMYSYMSFSQDKKKIFRIGEIEVDFLSSYYEQDGDHSAIWAGKGNQFLTDKVASLTLNIPVNDTNIFNFGFSLDAYTSASNDSIDFVESSASTKEERAYWHISYSRITKRNSTWEVKLYNSIEWDVVSYSASLSGLKESKDKNKSIAINLTAIYDSWDLIYPNEFRYDALINGPLLNDSARFSLNSSISYKRVLNKRLQAAFTYEFMHQRGLLSIPYHRVFFDDGIDFELFKKRDIERLPEERYKHAISAKSCYYICNFMILKTFYRFYFDSFNVRANTASIEIPFKFTRFFSLYPFYRLHYQTAAKYFQPYGGHDVDAEFYTSDYDLAEITSQKVGLGLNISPALGIFRIKKFPAKHRTSSLKSINIRYAKYFRSDGLESFIISSRLAFAF